MRANITPKVQVISQKSRHTQKSQVILKSDKSYSKVTSHTQKSRHNSKLISHKSLDHTLNYFIIIIIIIIVVVVVVSEKICLDVKFTLKITKSILECRLLQICLAL